MRRLALALAAVALGVTGCDHGSSRDNAAPAPVPSPYTPRMVQRAFARVGLPLAHDHQLEVMTNAYGDSSTAAFFNNAAGDVQVVVLRDSETRWVTILVGGEERPVTRWSGNVSVTYPKRSPKALRVLLALTQLASDSMSRSRYWQGICVVYDRDGAGGDVREGTCPKDVHP